MSRLLQPNGDDYPEAAARHMRDSKALMARRRYHGAAYLAGYVVECALKTLIQLETGSATYSHKLSELCDDLDRLAVQAGTQYGRIYLAAAAPLRASRILNDWKPQLRYRGGDVSADDARAWQKDAAVAYRQIIGQLNLVGAI